jgi:hypothetical protein
MYRFVSIVISDHLTFYDVDISTLLQYSKPSVPAGSRRFSITLPFAVLSHIGLLFTASDRDNINLNVIRANVSQCCVRRLRVCCMSVLCT